MSEQADTARLPRRDLSLSAWCLGIFVGLFGIEPYFSDPGIVWIPDYGNFPVFHSSFYLYLVGVIIWSIVLCNLLIKMHRQYRGSLGLKAAIMALLTGILWMGHFLFYRSTHDVVVASLNNALLCTGAITLGITMILIGALYAQVLSGTSRILHPLVVISFIVAGIFGIAVGYIGGYSPLSIFTVFDIPLISIVMIIPCILAALFHLVVK